MAGPPYRPLDAQVIPRFAGIRTFMRAPHVTDLAGVDAVVYGIPFDTATSYRTGPRFGPEAIRSASALHPAVQPGARRRTSSRRCRSSTTATCPCRRATPSARTGRSRRRSRRSSTPASSPPRSAATTRSRSPSCARSRRGTGRSRSCSSTRTATRGSSTSASSTSTARRSSARSRRGCSTRTRRCRRACAARSTAPRTSTVAQRAGLHRAHDRRAARRSGRRRYGELVLEHGRRRGRCSCRSTSTSSTRRSRPGTGTPEVGGFSTAEALAFLRALRGIKLVGCDVVEVSPPYDGPGMRDRARRRRTSLYELLSLRASAARRDASNACLTFDVDAEAPILAESGLYARNAGVMSHQAYGPLVGVPRILDLLREYSLPATFFVPGWTADRYPQAVEAILAAGHEVGHHSYAHYSPFAQTEEEERADFERALATLRRARRRAEGFRCPSWEPELAHAADRRRARARLRLVADGLRQAVRARHGRGGDRRAAGALGARRLGAVRVHPAIRRSASAIESPAKVLDLWTQRARRDAPLRLPLRAHLPPVPLRPAAPRRGAPPLIEHALAAGDVEFVACRDVARRAREDPAIERRV